MLSAPGSRYGRSGPLRLHDASVFRLSLLQAALLHAPNKDVQAVLTEEGLTLKDDGWHAPVAGSLVSLLVGFNEPVVAGRIGCDLLIQLL